MASHLKRKMTAPDTDNEELIDSILETALSRVRSGQLLNVEVYCRQYPELEDQLRIMLPALIALEKPYLESSKTDGISSLPNLSFAEELADFKILSEIGRGAMGVVYEAIQRTLGRRVALKVMF